MIPLTPRFLIAAASGFDGLRDAPGSNLSAIMARLAMPIPHAQSDCAAAFVLHVGYASHLDIESNSSSWPLPLIASSRILGEFARRANILEEEPVEGDVFLVFDPSKGGFSHTGIVGAVKERTTSPAGRPRFDCHTVEWVGDPDRSKGTPSVIRTERRFYPDLGDRFIRWTRLASDSTAILRSA